jgi:hypothetical protein
MPKLAVEPGTPSWWGRAAAAIERLVTDRPGRPSALVRYATTAALPVASDWPGCIAFHEALGQVVLSDGANWFPISVGAHL